MILFLSLLASEILIFLGSIVYLHDRRNVTNRIFFFYSLVIAAWSIVNYFSVTISADQVLPWIRMVIALAVPHVFLFFLFVMNFPNRELTIPKRTLFYMLTLMFCLMGLAFTPYVFEGVVVTGAGPTPTPGPLIPVFAIFLVSLILLTFYLIAKKYIKSKGQEKKQWLWISFGLVVTYILIIGLVFLGVILYNDTNFVPYSALFILPLFFGTAFAILRYQFLNVKVIYTELLSFVVVIVGVWQTLLSESVIQKILQSSLTTIIVIFSVLLIRGVLRETKQRELLQKLSTELGSANEQLKTLDKARAEFISIASHQLRTPPATIKWYLAAVIAGDFGRLNPKISEALKKTEYVNNNLISLIDDLLNVSRIERGKMEFLFVQTDVEEISTAAVDQLRPQVLSKKLKMTFVKPKKHLPLIIADKEKLQQVFNNLVDNAIKYTKKGTIAVKISQNKNEILFSVTDTGKGMSQGEKLEIFEKYKRGKNSVHEAAGLGLGLYVAKIVVEHHHGKIWADSLGEGQGSTFSVSLPIKTDLTDESEHDLTATK